MKHLLKVIFVIAVIFGTYFYIDDSIDKVKHTTIKDLTYVLMGDNRNPAYKEQQEKRLDIVLEKMENGGFDIDETFLDALENNSHIQDVQWSINKNAYRGLDKVVVNLKLVNNDLVIPTKISFFVAPKSSILNFISNPSFSKLYPLLSIEMNLNGKTIKYNDSVAYEILVTLYNEEASKSFFIGLLKNR